jgi:hypothetical protein
MVNEIVNKRHSLRCVKCHKFIKNGLNFRGILYFPVCEKCFPTIEDWWNSIIIEWLKTHSEKSLADTVLEVYRVLSVSENYQNIGSKNGR